jgi:hypothetical protein
MEINTTNPVSTQVQGLEATPKALPAPGQVLVDGVGRLAPGAHGQDHRGGAGDDIAAGPDPFLGGLAGFRIGNDIAPLVQFPCPAWTGSAGVGAGAHGHDARSQSI